MRKKPKQKYPPDRDENCVRAVIGIQPLKLLQGKLSPKAKSPVLEWAVLHQDELMVDWELARQQAPLNRIDPLE